MSDIRDHQVGFAKVAIQEKETPYIVNILNKLEGQVGILYRLQASIENSLHSLHNTNAPKKTNESSDKSADNAVTNRLETVNYNLAELIENFDLIEAKLKSLV